MNQRQFAVEKKFYSGALRGQTRVQQGLLACGSTCCKKNGFSSWVVQPQAAPPEKSEGQLKSTAPFFIYHTIIKAYSLI